MKKITWTAAVGLILASTNAWSATGNDLMAWLPDYERNSLSWEGGMYLGYVAGISNVINGVVFCAPTVTNGQSAAVVAKFLRNNPERWGEDAASLVVESLRKAFPKYKQI